MCFYRINIKLPNFHQLKTFHRVILFFNKTKEHNINVLMKTQQRTFLFDLPTKNFSQHEKKNQN